MSTASCGHGVSLGLHWGIDVLRHPPRGKYPPHFSADGLPVPGPLLVGYRLGQSLLQNLRTAVPLVKRTSLAHSRQRRHSNAEASPCITVMSKRLSGDFSSHKRNYIIARMAIKVNIFYHFFAKFLKLLRFLSLVPLSACN